MKERWMWIKGFEGRYKISNCGRIMSFKGKSSKELKLYKNRKGYYYISLQTKNNNKNFRIARLVAIHFIPNLLNKPQVNHKDGDKTNNHYSNLEWVTSQENNLHACCVLGKNCGFKKGENNFATKLTWEKVREIRTKQKLGVFSYERLAEIYGTSRQNIRFIVNYKTWQDKP